MDPKNIEDARFLYARAVEARNFHYDNFTKWQTFFYVAVGSVLVAYYKLVFDSSCSCCQEPSETPLRDIFKTMLPALGYIFSLIWLCSSKGYTYWWNAYMEKLKAVERIYIDMIPNLSDEKEKEKKKDLSVYSSLELCLCDGLLNPTKGANFSTSKLANALAFISTWAWGILLLSSFSNFSEIWDNPSWGQAFMLVCAPYSLSVFAVSVMNLLFSSNLIGFKPKGKEHVKCCLFLNIIFSLPAAVFILMISLCSRSKECCCFDFIAILQGLAIVYSLFFEKVRNSLCNFFNKSNKDQKNEK